MSEQAPTKDLSIQIVGWDINRADSAAVDDWMVFTVSVEGQRHTVPVTMTFVHSLARMFKQQAANFGDQS